MAINIKDGEILVGVQADSGTGTNLALKAGQGASSEAGGAITFHSYDDSSSGIDTVFTITATGGLTMVNGATIVNTSASLLTIDEAQVTLTGDLQVSGNDIKDSGGSAALTFDGSSNVTAAANLTVTGDLLVSGTTTTLDTQNLLVEDPIVILNKANETANGQGGIAIEMGGSSADMVFGRVANDTWGVGTKDTSGGTVTTLADMTLGALRSGKLEIDGANDHIDVDTDLTLTAAADVAFAAGGGNVKPSSNDGAALGVSGTAWSDLFLASGAVVNFNAGDVTMTHSENLLSVEGGNTRVEKLEIDGAGNSIDVDTDLKIVAAADLELTTSNAGSVKPASDDNSSLGESGTAWSDLFLASGAVVNFNAGDVTMTHSANLMSIAGGNTRVERLEIDSADDHIDMSGGNLVITAGTSDADIVLDPAGSDVKVDGHMLPNSSDVGALGSASLMWSDAFLASGAVINFNAGDVTMTHSENLLSVAGGNLRAIRLEIDGANDYIDVETDLKVVAAADIVLDPGGSDVKVDGNMLPNSSNGGALGSADLMWSDAFLADGAVINFNADVTMTHSENLLNISGGNTRVDKLEIDGAGNSIDVDTDLKIVASADVEINAGGGNVKPSADGDTALGVSGTAWSDLFLADEAVINFNAGDVTMTHSANLMAISGGNTRVDRLEIDGADDHIDMSSGNLVITAGTSDADILLDPVGGDVKIDGHAVPNSSDGGALGSASLMWSDAFMAAGAVINFNAGDVTMTHSANLLNISGGNTRVDRLEIDGASDYIDVETDLKVVAAADILLDPVGGDVKIDGNIIPVADDTYDLGSSSARFANIFTGDLDLTNDRGSWTLIEEENFISFRNNKTGRRFAMVMEDITDLGNYGPGNDGRM